MRELLDNGLRSRLESMMSAKVTTALPVRHGYTVAQKFLVEFSNGTSAFVKAATDAETSLWLRDEHRIYKSFVADFLPRLIDWSDDGDFPVLVLEDLSSGLWPNVWTESMVVDVLKTLKRVREFSSPVALPSLEKVREFLTGWHLVKNEPEQFLGLGLCTEEWLQYSLPVLIQSENSVLLEGSQLLHLDVRSDNICFIDNRVVFVDWNWACVGNGMLDVVAWLPSMVAEGMSSQSSSAQSISNSFEFLGNLEDLEMNTDDNNLVALVSGYWASRAGLPPPTADSQLRHLQLKQLKVALPWCAKLLGLPPLLETALK